ncbi:hypothetical protein Taro_037348 [Colocasia esculenta]|uniref:Uncharacterized protein n=1 Tax=Colocasia esculenta TaxID=4460 RepID=A0A843WCL0_COLES|nr:hypothetical protein [Colocasia esculenta]
MSYVSFRLLKATGPMSPSHVQRVKCSGREHKPQFAPLLCASLISGVLKLGSFVETWEEVVDHLARGARRGTVVRPDYGSCGYLWFRVSLRWEVSDMDRWLRNEVRLLSLGRLRSRKTRIHNSVPLKRRRHYHCRVQEGTFASVAFRRKEGDAASVALPGETSQKFPPRRSEETGLQ